MRKFCASSVHDQVMRTDCVMSWIQKLINFPAKPQQQARWDNISITVITRLIGPYFTEILERKVCFCFLTCRFKGPKRVVQWSNGCTERCKSKEAWWHIHYSCSRCSKCRAWRMGKSAEDYWGNIKSSFMSLLFPVRHFLLLVNQMSEHVFDIHWPQEQTDPFEKKMNCESTSRWEGIEICHTSLQEGIPAGGWCFLGASRNCHIPSPLCSWRVRCTCESLASGYLIQEILTLMALSGVSQVTQVRFTLTTRGVYGRFGYARSGCVGWSTSMRGVHR